MKWNPMPAEKLIPRLRLPGGKLNMVLDTDTYNEVDDQFALCYSLLSRERLNVQAVYAAPFFNDRSSGPEDGMEKSYDEIVRLLGTMNLQSQGFVFKGSRSYLPGEDTPVISPAAEDLVKKGMAMPEGELLYVTAIGAITNVASALLLEPAIAEKIVLVWLGGNAWDWPDNHELDRKSVV